MEEAHIAASQNELGADIGEVLTVTEVDPTQSWYLAYKEGVAPGWIPIHFTHPLIKPSEKRLRSSSGNTASSAVKSLQDKERDKEKEGGLSITVELPSGDKEVHDIDPELSIEVLLVHLLAAEQRNPKVPIPSLIFLFLHVLTFRL
jgi:hypothetical protein